MDQMFNKRIEKKERKKNCEKTLRVLSFNNKSENKYENKSEEN